MKEIKPGWKTTEFWVTLATVVVGGLVTLGYLPKEQGDHLLPLVIFIIGLVMPAVSYNYGRAAVKSAAMKSGP